MLDVTMVKMALETALSELGSVRRQIKIWGPFIEMEEFKELIIREELVRDDIRRYQRELS